jgi:hypothetical protein
MSPNGIRMKRYKPALVVKAVLSRSSGATLICQYPDLKSSVVKSYAPLNASNVSSIRGSG